MAQAVSHWPVIANGPVKSIASQCGICGGPSDTGRDLFPPLHYHPTNTPYSSSCSY